MLDDRYKKLDIAKIVKKGASDFFRNSAKGKGIPSVVVKKVFVKKVIKKGGEKE
jgi:hypothetical protein